MIGFCQRPFLTFTLTFTFTFITTEATLRRWIRTFPPLPTSSLELAPFLTSQLHWIITLQPWVQFSSGKKRLKAERQGFQTTFAVWRADITRQSYERLKFAAIFYILKNIVKNQGNPPGKSLVRTDFCGRTDGRTDKESLWFFLCGGE